MSNNEIIPAKQKMQNLRTLLTSEKVTKQIMAALPRHIDGQRLFRVYLTAVQTTPRILDCDPISVVGAVIQAAQVGLSLDSVFGEGFLIPRYNKNTGGFVANFQTGYKGLCKLARDSDKGIRDIYARVVHANDQFEYSYEPKMLRHTPCEDPDARGPIKYAYAKVIWKEDNYDRFVLITSAEIQKAQSASDSFKKGFGPWVDNAEAMWAKTALRRLCGTLSLSTESGLARAIVAEDDERGGFASLPGLDVDLSLPAPVQSHRDEAPLDRLAGQGPEPVPPVQRRRRRGAEQQAAAAESAPAAQASGRPDPFTSSRLQDDDVEEERIVGNIDRRTGEVIE
jgi:recombination protein RecT